MHPFELGLYICLFLIIAIFIAVVRRFKREVKRRQQDTQLFMAQAMKESGVVYTKEGWKKEADMSTQTTTVEQKVTPSPCTKKEA